MSRVLTLAQLTALAEILAAAQGNQPVTILESSGAVSVGQARHLCRDVYGAGFLTREDDVRDAYLRVTMRSGFERFIPISELIPAVVEGRVALNYDAGTRR